MQHSSTGGPNVQSDIRQFRAHNAVPAGDGGSAQKEHTVSAGIQTSDQTPRPPASMHISPGKHARDNDEDICRSMKVMRMSPEKNLQSDTTKEVEKVTRQVSNLQVPDIHDKLDMPSKTSNGSRNRASISASRSLFPKCSSLKHGAPDVLNKDHVRGDQDGKERNGPENSRYEKSNEAQNMTEKARPNMTMSESNSASPVIGHRVTWSRPMQHSINASHFGSEKAANLSKDQPTHSQTNARATLDSNASRQWLSTSDTVRVHVASHVSHEGREAHKHGKEILPSMQAPTGHDSNLKPPSLQHPASENLLSTLIGENASSTNRVPNVSSQNIKLTNKGKTSFSPFEKATVSVSSTAQDNAFLPGTTEQSPSFNVLSPVSGISTAETSLNLTKKVPDPLRNSRGKVPSFSFAPQVSAESPPQPPSFSTMLKTYSKPLDKSQASTPKSVPLPKALSSAPKTNLRSFDFQSKLSQPSFPSMKTTGASSTMPLNKGMDTGIQNPVMDSSSRALSSVLPNGNHSYKMTQNASYNLPQSPDNFLAPMNRQPDTSVRHHDPSLLSYKTSGSSFAREGIRRRDPTPSILASSSVTNGISNQSSEALTDNFNNTSHTIMEPLPELATLDAASDSDFRGMPNNPTFWIMLTFQILCQWTVLLLTSSCLLRLYLWHSPISQLQILTHMTQGAPSLALFTSDCLTPWCWIIATRQQCHHWDVQACFYSHLGCLGLFLDFTDFWQWLNQICCLLFPQCISAFMTLPIVATYW